MTSIPQNGMDSGRQRWTPPGNIVATYDYRDESGHLLYQAVRMEPKKFLQRRPNGPGTWIWNTDGVSLVPYHLVQILERPSDIIYIVEGEKDADRLECLGLLSTCNAMGAGKWKDDYNRWFKERRCVVLPDNDRPGDQHATLVASNIIDHAAWVKVIKLPGLPEKGDVSDWLDAGGSIEELERLVQETARWKPTEARQTRSLRRQVPSYSFAVEDRVARVRHAVDVLAVFERHGVYAKTVHQRIVRLNCPFHGEKTPSLNIWLDTNTWYCFGCGEGTDVIDAVMKLENLTFGDALTELCRSIGMDYPSPDAYKRSVKIGA